MSQNVIIDCATGVVTYSPLTPEQIAASAPTEQDYSNAIQARIDGVANERQYANGVALASYVNSTNSQWAAEASAFVAWRDAVWSYAYQELAKVQAGTRPQPTIEALIAELPAIVWP